MRIKEDKSQLVTIGHLEKATNQLRTEIKDDISRTIFHLMEVLPEMIEKRLEKKFVTKDEFNELKEVVYGNSEDIIKIKDILDKELVIRNKQYDDKFRHYDNRISRVEYTLRSQNFTANV